MGISLRSVIIGAILIPLNCMWIALVDIVWYSGEPTTLSLFANVIFILCLLTIINAAIRKSFPSKALSPNELLVIYIMLAISTSLAGHDMLEVLIPALCFLNYFIPIEGRYDDIAKLVPSWLHINDPTALVNAYIGQESIFLPTNYIPWLRPLAWWYAYTLALCAIMWGITLLLRKQWTEHEKLAYPIIQPPMLIALEPQKLASSRIFWLAFGLAASIDAINGLHVLYPMWPRIPIVQVLNIQTLFVDRPWKDMGGAWISFYPCIIGMCFFMPLDLAFSAWFFFLLFKLQLVLVSYYGVQGMPGFPHIHEQAVGGYYAVALIAIWISRKHLAKMTMLFLGRHHPDTNRSDLWEARLGFGLIMAGASFLYAFCHMAGMSPKITITFFGIYFLLSTGITRLRAELGPPSHDLFPVGAHRQLVSILGAVNMRHNNPRDLAMFGFLGFSNRVMRTHPMPQAMEAFRMAERLGLNRWRLLAVMGLAIAITIPATFLALLWAFYKYGIASRMSPLPEYFARESWDAVHLWLNSPPKWTPGPAYAIFVGLIFGLGLAALRMNLAWWPLHPAGFAMSACYTMERIWFCVFIAWLAKNLILKYGGVKAYRPASNAFLGLLLGDFIVGSFWYTYGIIMETKIYHFWPY